MGHGLWLREEGQEETRSGGRAEGKVQEVGRSVDPQVKGEAEDREERNSRGVLGLSELMKQSDLGKPLGSGLNTEDGIVVQSNVTVKTLDREVTLLQ